MKREMKDGWLGWAVFVGMSWTWCIGMFLPVLLVHDYGVWAWLVFAVPNVVGAAAMAWTISAGRSRLMVEAHRPAMIAFSTITVAFQLFFAVWAFSRPPWQAAFYPWYLLGVVLVAIAGMVRNASRLLSIMILFASIVCAIGMFCRGEASLTATGVGGNLSLPPSSALLWLTPVCFFGFLLCPYLDATFHRARQHLADRNAKRAFGIGFGVVFLSAIVLTLLYCRPVHVAMNSYQRVPLILRWVKVYWMLQLGFTIGVHLIGDDAHNQEQRAWPSAIIAAAGILIGAIALGIGQKFMIPGETVYRAFLGFYGLVFPAYVWLAVLPGRGVLTPTRRAMAVLAIAVAIALPMFYLAFIQQRLFWAVPGVAVVLLSRALISKSAGNPQDEMGLGFTAQQNSAPTS